MITVGGFNAETRTLKAEYPEKIDKHGKGRSNKNGKCLLEYAKEHDMILANTMFNHKMCHKALRTTPERITHPNHHDGNPRRKLYRNQIGYVIIKDAFRRIANNSRSYGGFETNSDNKAVITRLVEGDNL